MAEDPPQINGYPIDPELYRLLVEHGYLTTRTNFMSDVEIAQKLNLDLPELTPIKTALNKNDATALAQALVNYLNSKLPPLKPEDLPRPAPYNDSPKIWQRPDAWLGSEITFIVNDHPKTYTIGEGVNWFITGDGEPDIKGWSWWGSCLTSAYLATGDPKYAQGILTYARSFYKNCPCASAKDGTTAKSKVTKLFIKRLVTKGLHKSKGIPAANVNPIKFCQHGTRLTGEDVPHVNREASEFMKGLCDPVKRLIRRKRSTGNVENPLLRGEPRSEQSVMLYRIKSITTTGED